MGVLLSNGCWRGPRFLMTRQCPIGFHDYGALPGAP
jgi:hypothetical protein